MTAQPLVSVIVPVYNAEEYLDRCVKSLLGQTLSNIEIILVDDGSTDRSGVILENLAAESYRTVRPEYFQVLLESKYVRDPESLNNMKMLFDSETRFEIEHVYAWNTFENQVIAGLTGKADRFASTVKSRAAAVNKMIAETLEYLAKES